MVSTMTDCVTHQHRSQPTNKQIHIQRFFFGIIPRRNRRRRRGNSKNVLVRTMLQILLPRSSEVYSFSDMGSHELWTGYVCISPPAFSRRLVLPRAVVNPLTRFGSRSNIERVMCAEHGSTHFTQLVKRLLKLICDSIMALRCLLLLLEGYTIP
jgi:hypothetical protein